MNIIDQGTRIPSSPIASQPQPTSTRTSAPAPSTNVEPGKKTRSPASHASTAIQSAIAAMHDIDRHLTKDATRASSSPFRARIPAAIATIASPAATTAATSTRYMENVGCGSAMAASRLVGSSAANPAGAYRSRFTTTGSSSAAARARASRAARAGMLDGDSHFAIAAFTRRQPRAFHATYMPSSQPQQASPCASVSECPSKPSADHASPSMHHRHAASSGSIGQPGPRVPPLVPGAASWRASTSCPASTRAAALALTWRTISGDARRGSAAPAALIASRAPIAVIFGPETCGDAASSKPRACMASADSDRLVHAPATRPSTDAARSSSFPPGTCIPTADANDAVAAPSRASARRAADRGWPAAS
ncbi:MAG: hypothetical protein Q6370_007135, partial [Candidatus Sigynarchaeota archaeon]